MMKKIAYILPLVAGLALTTACDDEDYRNPSAIVNDYIGEHTQLLTSSEKGWRFDYYPNESEYGAFTFLMKFREDGRVEMLTDENFFYLYATEEEQQRAYEPQESDYTVQNSQGPVLTFATYSLLTKLADPELFNNGSGWQGDNEFILMGHSADGDTIYLKSVKAQRRCNLVKNTADWDTFFAGMNNVIRDFEDAEAANSYFRDIVIADRDTAVLTGLNMTSRRGFVYRYQDGKMKADTCQLLFTPEGVQLKRPVQLANSVITHFAYNGTKEFLVNGESNATIKIAENGRPKMTFDVRTKVLKGSYEVIQDGVSVPQTDMYFVESNPETSVDEWNALYETFQAYQWMVLLPDGDGKYYVDLYDQRTNASGQAHYVLARCGFSHSWSVAADDEISFRGIDNTMYFLGTDTESGSYEQGTPLAKEFEASVKTAYRNYLTSLFGTSRNRINCVVVPSPDEQYYYFVNKADGTAFGIMKMY